LLICFVVQFFACHSFRRSRAIIAWALTALVLLLNAMAVSPALHAMVHADAGDTQHQCAVTLFAHGQVDAASVDVPIASLTALPERSLRFEFSVFAPVVDQLLSGRAPPVSCLPA
jgi:hypothetical protein